MYANTTKDKRHLRGYKSEFLVGQYYLRQGYKIIAHRYKTPFAEIDLICQDKNQNIVMVEVKTASDPFWQSHRVSRRQKQRLKNACHYLHGKSGKNIEVHLALVEKKGKIDILTDFLS